MSSESRTSGDSNGRLDRLLAEYARAVEAGQSVDEEALVREHPDLADQLRDFFRQRRAARPPTDPVRQGAPTVALAADGSASSSEPTPPPENAGAGSGASQPFAPAVRVRYFGDYELLQEIARGGMGVVFKARQVTLNRIVALKMILAGQLAGEREVERFRAEAEAAANLDHPGIVPIFEVGVHDHQHYFSMGYVAGTSLAATLSGGPLAPDRAAQVVAQVADAVQYAHDHRVIHRDLKPANILLDQDGRPKVTDFGLAKRVGGTRDLTATGQVLGTPSFMPPEQAAGRLDEISPLTDVYSLGAILYNAVAGRPPFQSDSVQDTVRQVLEREPVSPRELNPSVPRDLETIVLKCLEKEPRRRYPTAVALADELRRFLRREPIEARPISRVERTWRWARRRPDLAALAGVSLLALLASVGAAVSAAYNARLRESLEETDRLRQIADDQRREADEQRAEADRQRAVAIRQRQFVRQFLYAADINLIKQSWDSSQMARMRQLLARNMPNAADPDAAEQAGQPASSDLRGFEWHYLWKLAHAERQVLAQHDGVLRSVLWSPDGSRVLTGDGSNVNNKPGQLRVWNAATGQLERTLFTQGEKSPSGSFLGIQASAITADGKLVATSDETKIRLLKLEDGSERHVLISHRDFVHALAFSPDGTLLASGSLDGDVKLWNVTDGTERATIDTRPHGVMSLAFSPAGERIVAGGGDQRAPTWSQLQSGGLAIWSTESHEKLVAMDAGSLVESAAFSLDGKRVASAHATGQIVVWDAVSGAKLQTLSGHAAPAHAAAFARDGRLATAGDDPTIRLWDPNGTLLGTLKGHESRVTCLAFSRDGTLVSGGDDQTARIWGDTSSLERANLGVQPWAINSLDFSADGSLLASAGYSSVTLHDVGSLVQRGQCGTKHWTFNMALSPDGTLIATGGNQGASGQEPGVVEIWDAKTGTHRATLDAKVRSVKRVRFSPDGQWLLAWGWGGDERSRGVALWRSADWEPQATWPGNTASFSPDSRLVAVARADTALVWDTTTRSMHRELEGQSGELAVVEFSPDGRTLATGGRATTVVLWDVETGKMSRELAGHSTGVSQIRFTPDGQSLVSMAGETKIWSLAGDGDPATISIPACGCCITPDSRTLVTDYAGVRLWQIPTGQELLRLPGYSLFSTCLAISPDGRTLAQGGGYRDENEGVYVWQTEPLPARSPDTRPRSASGPGEG